jgi:hypothetical protein
MNRLVIIGNGFDLAHGLKTSYRDFLLDYLKKTIDKVIREHHHEDDLWDVSTSRNYEAPKSDWLDRFDNFKELKEHAESILVKFKFKGSFFKEVCKDVENKNWVDIENLFYKSLTEIIFKPESHNAKDEVEELYSEFNQLKKLLIQYIQYESGSYELKRDMEGKIHNILGRNLHELSKTGLKLSLEDSDEIDKTILLNFNYTSIVEQYMKELNGKRFDEIKIHGNVNEENSIVFGFGDDLDKHYKEIEELNVNRYFEYIKSFKYFQNTEYQKLINFIKAGRFEVYVLGHSLGLSDRTMLNQIFESKYMVRVKMFYYEHDGTDDFVDKTYEISRHFNDKGRMREKIVPFTESEPMPQTN